MVRIRVGSTNFSLVLGGAVRAVKLKISREEWDYCFHFSVVEVMDFTL